ncbi:MAG: hypothetical protein ACLPKW_13670 [Acetobacteraceae bacterium]
MARFRTPFDPDIEGEERCTQLFDRAKRRPAWRKSWHAGSKEGAIPIISDVPGFQAYYVIYAPDDTVTAISIFDDYAGAQESNRRGLAWIEQSLAPLLIGPATAVAGPVIVHTLA